MDSSRAVAGYPQPYPQRGPLYLRASRDRVDDLLTPLREALRADPAPPTTLNARTTGGPFRPCQSPSIKRRRPTRKEARPTAVVAQETERSSLCRQLATAIGTAQQFAHCAVEWPTGVVAAPAPQMMGFLTSALTVVKNFRHAARIARMLTATSAAESSFPRVRRSETNGFAASNRGNAMELPSAKASTALFAGVGNVLIHTGMILYIYTDLRCNPPLSEGMHHEEHGSGSPS